MNSLTIKDSKFDSAWDGDGETAKNGTLAVLRPYCPTTIENCVFTEKFGETGTYQFIDVGAVKTVEFNGCNVVEDLSSEKISSKYTIADLIRSNDSGTKTSTHDSVFIIDAEDSNNEYVGGVFLGKIDNINAVISAKGKTVKTGYLLKKKADGTDVTADVVVPERYRIEADRYTVTWKNSDDTLIKEEQYNYGETPVSPATPVKPSDESFAYVFKEWTPAVSAVTADVTYTAVYDKKALAPQTLTASVNTIEKSVVITFSPYDNTKVYEYSMDEKASWVPLDGITDGKFTQNNLETGKTYKVYLRVKAGSDYLASDEKVEGFIVDAHIHVYDQEKVSDEYLRSAGTCTKNATYYYSCECGRPSSDDTGTYFEKEDSKVAHSFVNHAAVSKTCNTDGTNGYRECSSCGVIYKLNTDIATTIEAEKIPAGHTLREREGLMPTMNASGYTAYKKCSVCSLEFGKVELAQLTVPSVSMSGYTYGTTPSTPGLSETPTEFVSATYYYSTSATGDGTIWENITGTSLNAGTYYMYANVVRTGSDAAKTLRTSFTVNQAETVKPVISGVTPTPANHSATVTINQPLSGRTYQYSLDGINWKTIQSLTSGTFTISNLNAGTYNVYLKVTASSDGNYKASASSAANAFTLSEPETFIVSYNANGGVGSIVSQLGSEGSSVEVLSPNGQITRSGYTFAGWKDESGTAHSAGSTVTSGMTLYAQWTPITFTVVFDANGGTGDMEVETFKYDVSQALFKNKYTLANSHFTGWSLTKDAKASTYADGQVVSNLSATNNGTVTLYAVWAQNVYNVTGTVKDSDNNPYTGNIRIELKSGNTVLLEKNTPSFSFAGVAPGTYNLVATTEAGQVVTSLVIVTNKSETADIILPEKNTNSVVDVSEKNNTPAVIVGNLNTEAETKADVISSVTVKMAVESKVEKVVAEIATGSTEKQKEEYEAELKTQEDIRGLKEKITEEVAEYLDFTVTQTITNGSTTKTETLKETNTILEIVIPHDTTKKKDITVYRNHNGEARKLDEEKTKREGTFWVDLVNHLIYIYSQNYSTYAITFNKVNDIPGPTPTQPTSSGSSVTTFHGTETAKADGTIAFDRSTVVTKVVVTGASGAKLTPTSEKGENGWYGFDLTVTDAANGGEIFYQVPLDVISIKGFTEQDVCLYHKENGTWTALPTYLTGKDAQYAYYKSVTKSFSPFYIGFEAGAAKTKGSDTPVAPVVEPVVDPIAPVAPQPTATPAPVLGLLAGLGAAAVLLKRRQ